ncbi:MAG: tetratricopeptide repeat protein [Bacteroidetes bacterium]|nr:tetratricopeptide repeat protein [Bacteroidota bacterium]MBS1930520.1 tetratricopeptide repeat protein [Bacteroidota bacterium]
MKENPFREDREQMRELLKLYENLKQGRSHSFIEEDSFEKIINYFEEKEDWNKALEAARLAVQQFVYSSVLLIKKAEVLLELRSYKEALAELNQAELLDQGNIDLYILKTDVYLALDQQDKAVVLLEKAISLFQGEERVELLFELADVYDDYEGFDKVFDCLKLILEDEPNNEEALYKICFWTDFTGRSEESIRLHQRIIDDFPYNELAWFNLAAAYQSLKLYEKAIDAYQFAITIDEKFDFAYRNMGDAYIRLKKFKEAIEVLEKVIELAKPESVIYEAIGHCYDRVHNYAQARFYYRKASHMNPGESKLFYKIACTYFNEQQWESCARQLDIAIKQHQLKPEYSLLMGECKMLLGLHKEAIQYFSNVVRLRPRNTTGWEALIRCLFKGEFFEEALEQVNAALQFTQGKPLFLYYKSAILFRLQHTAKALVQLEMAMEKSPKGLKRFIEIYPSILQNQQVVDILARFKRKKSI